MVSQLMRVSVERRDDSFIGNGEEGGWVDTFDQEPIWVSGWGRRGGVVSGILISVVL